MTPLSSTVKLAIVLGVVFGISGVFLRVMTALGASEVTRRHRVRQDRPSRIEAGTHRKSVILNSLVSTGMLVGIPLLLQTRLFVSGPVSLLRTVSEATEVLLLYDFGYYLLHRFVLHEWSVGRKVHSVHHTVRTPYAEDSLYIHPAETAAGLTVFLGCIAIVGPIGLSSFGLAFLVYSLLNVFIHSGVDLRFFPFRTLTAMVRNHDIHHDSMKAGCYASITPLWDLVFRTAGPPRERGAG